MATTTATKSAKTKKTRTNKTTIGIKDFTNFIISKVIPNDSDLTKAKDEIEGIQNNIYTYILSIAGTAIINKQAVDMIKMKVYDQAIYPDAHGNFKKLGREKLLTSGKGSAKDEKVSAKEPDRMKAPNTLAQVFSTLTVATTKTRSVKTSRGSRERFGADLKVSLKSIPRYNPEDEGDENNLRTQIAIARSETSSAWFSTYDELVPLCSPKFKTTDLYKDIVREQDTHKASQLIDRFSECLTDDFPNTLDLGKTDNFVLSDQSTSTRATTTSKTTKKSKK